MAKEIEKILTCDCGEANVIKKELIGNVKYIRCIGCGKKLLVR